LRERSTRSDQLLRKSGRFDKKSKRFHLGEAFDNEMLSPQQFLVFKRILLGNTAEEMAHPFESVKAHSGTSPK